MIAAIPGTLVVWRWGFVLRLVWIDLGLAYGQGKWSACLTRVRA